MMKRGKKLWIAAVAIGFVAISTVAWAGESLYQGYQVVRVLVNGREIQSPVPAISFNGSTLIPLRAAVEALGASVTWDPATSTASITAGQQTSGADTAALQQESKALKTELEATKGKLAEAQRSLDAANAQLHPPISDKGRGRTNPMPTGQTLTASLTQGKLGFTGRFTITEAIRGDQAWQRLLATNQFNDPPSAGYEYVLVKMKYEVLGVSDPEAAVSVDEYWFTAVSASGRDYPRVSLVDPDPQVGTKLYSGASAEGYMAFAVEKTDAAPVLTFARDSQGKNGYWMELKSLTAANRPVPSAPGSGGSVPPSTGGVPTNPAEIKTPDALMRYLKANYGSVSTPTGTVTVNFEFLTNDRTFMPYDLWIQMRFVPSSYFLDLATKVNISAADKQASIEKLRQHARAVYNVAAAAFPGQKIMGEYYDSWYTYPTLQVGYEARSYLSWQNYEDNLLAGGDSYANSQLSEFHFEPRWDDTKF